MRNTLRTTARKGARRVRGIGRLGPAAIAATVALALGGAAAAGAATGASFILGRANHEKSTALLSDSRGTPLKLTAPPGNAPLEVNRETMVKNLNAQYVGGLSGSQVAATGGVGFTNPKTVTPINTTAAEIVTTGPLPAGTYYVNAYASLDIAAGDGGGDCYLVKGSNVSGDLADAGSSGTGEVQAAETVAVRLSARDSVQELCYSFFSSGPDNVYDAGITAIRILNSSGSNPADTGAALNKRA